MSVCVLYIMLSGGVFMTPTCIPADGVIYPDKIVYADSIPDIYPYVSYRTPVRRPSMVYRDWRPLPYRRDHNWRSPRRAHRRNITINRHYYQGRKPISKPVNKRRVKTVRKKNKKKNKFNKKK